MLRRLAWSSIPSPLFSAARLNQIIAPSRRNNERHQISGMLLFTGAHFLSILEGEERDLDDLWWHLERDPRHCNLFRIGNDLCETRMYPEWLMAFEVDSKVDAQIESLRSLQSAGARARSGTRRPPQTGCTPMWARIIQPIMAHADSM
jgi:FAD-dependent sensor of blue light